jgi:HNH endonuclease
LAQAIGRTPDAVVYKACNFASLDPFHQARGVKGFGNVSRADRVLWTEFAQNSEAVAAEAESAWERLVSPQIRGDQFSSNRCPPPGSPEESAPLPLPDATIPSFPTGPTEAERLVRTRRVQTFFRSAVLASYDFRCALTGLAVPELLTASHIIPWNENVERRADPRNGIALNALYDRAFDRGLIAFDADHRIILSSRLQTADPGPWHRDVLLSLSGQPLTLPRRFLPDPEALAWHRECLFVP